MQLHITIKYGIIITKKMDYDRLHYIKSFVHFEGSLKLISSGSGLTNELFLDPSVLTLKCNDLI